MGQAKTRGSFERRKALAIAKAAAEKVVRQRLSQEARKQADIEQDRGDNRKSAIYGALCKLLGVEG